jgi:hypothetical protein
VDDANTASLARQRIESLFVEDAGILVMEDQAAIVDRKVAEFVKGLPKVAQEQLLPFRCRIIAQCRSDACFASRPRP